MKKFLLFFISTLLLLSSSTLLVHADCEQTDLDAKIACLSAKVNELQNQTKTLAGQIAFYDSQIELSNLKIKQTEDQINIFSTKIDSLESKLQERSVLLKGQIVQTYKKGPLDGFEVLLSSGDVSELISRFKYLQIVQANNRKFLHDTQVVQTNYQQQKDLISESKKKLESQKVSLASIRTQRDELLTQTKSSEVNYQKLLVEAHAQRDAIRRRVQSLGGAPLLSNQTHCDGWGCYYNQRDSQWGNVPMGISNLSLAEFGCLVSSSAMIATHYGKDLKPVDIAYAPNAFYSPDSGTAQLWDVASAKGVTIHRIKGQSRSTADNELSSGRPVIAELFGGAHFIVLKSGSNGNYVINDPFEENGHDIQFSSKYKPGDITDYEKVVIQ